MDISYFEEAIDFLAKQKTIKSDQGIGVCGISKGAEVCLAMAAALPSSKLGAIVVLNALMSYSMVDVFYKKSFISKGKLNFLKIQLNAYDFPPCFYRLETSFPTTSRKHKANWTKPFEHEWHFEAFPQ